MQPTDDSALLREFAESGSDEAFAMLVTRHINLVFSVALRQVGNPHNAEEIVQAVFVILARKASRLSRIKSLGGWLFQTTRLTANNFIRSEMRRLHREQEAYMQTTLNESGDEIWRKISPLLDAAIATLNAKDRQAVILRFYQDKTAREIGEVLGASEGATEMRIQRAVEKLQKYFLKRGVDSTPDALVGAMAANSIQMAPAGLAAAKGAAASTSTLTLIHGALKIMAWTKAKTAIAAGITIITLTLGVGSVCYIAKTHSPRQVLGTWNGSKGASVQFSRDGIATLHASSDDLARNPSDPPMVRGSYKILDGSHIQLSLSGVGPIALTYSISGDTLTLAIADKEAKTYMRADTAAASHPQGAPAADSATEQKNRNACINNLRQIDGAINEWALETGKSYGSMPKASDLLPYLRDGKLPVCPDGGKYMLYPVGSNPQVKCSVAGHELP